MEGKRKAVVMGGTGRQGGGVVQHLAPLAAKYAVVVISRNPASKEARALVEKYPFVELVKADANDKESLVAAFQGAACVFAVTNPFAVSSRSWSASTRPTDGSVEGEERQGRNIVDACKAAGVGHLVYTSCASATEKTGVPTFEAKAAVEAYMAASGVPHTILGPVGCVRGWAGWVGGAVGGVASGWGGGARRGWVGLTWD